MVDKDGYVTKAWMPFLRDIGESLEQINAASEGNLIAVDSTGRLVGSSVTDQRGETFSAYNEDALEIDTSDDTLIIFDTVSNESDQFEKQSGSVDIVCLFDGTVKITYHTTVECTTYSNNTTIQQKLQLGRTDYTDIDGTLSECIIKSSSDRANMSAKRLLDVKKFDIIRSVFSVVSGSSTVETVAEACNITLERLK
jgi:hypothetical protein